MQLEERFDKLVDITQELSNLVEKLTQRVIDLEGTVRYQEGKLNTLQYEIYRINGMTDTW